MEGRDLAEEDLEKGRVEKQRQLESNPQIYIYIYIYIKTDSKYI
jgi:hypothetical protein